MSVTNSEVRSPKTRPDFRGWLANGFFLRHEAGAAGDVVGQLQPAEFLAGVEDPVFGQAAQVQHGGGSGVEKIERESRSADTSMLLFGDGVEAQVAGDSFAIEGESGGQCAGAERQNVDARAGPGASAPDHGRNISK